LIINWQNGEIQSVHFKSSMDFDEFITSVQILFQTYDECRLYYLPIGDIWSNREKIEDMAALVERLPHVPKAKSAKDKLVFYVFFGDVSPDGSPCKAYEKNSKNNVAKQESPKQSLSSSEKADSRKSNSHHQAAFRKHLLTRDRDMCRFCSYPGTVVACHIIDIKWVKNSKTSNSKLTPNDLLEKFGLTSVYYPANGMLLCPNCHKEFDDFEIGVTTEGVIICRDQTKPFNGKLLFEESEVKRAPLLFPTQSILKFRFDEHLRVNEDRAKRSTTLLAPMKIEKDLPDIGAISLFK
jgi:hypothetical protein